MAGTHALLSPSAAHRWLHCTAAPRLEQREEDQGSAFAEEGTLAHAYCAKKLKTYLSQPVDMEEDEIASLDAEYHTGEMDEFTDSYAALVIGKYEDTRQSTNDARLLVETKLDLSSFIPECSGTADAIIIADGTMEVIDFKYGKGVKVEAAENPQMMSYALGAWAAFSFEYRIEKVRMTIVQPRIDNVSEWELSVDDLTGWANKTLRPKAEEAYGKGRTEPGEWCRFCKVRSRCRALAKYAEALTEMGDPRLLSEQELAEVLPKLDTVRTWLNAVEEYTLQQALSGVTYKGYKLVEGRSIRRISDQEAVIKVLSAEYQPEDFMRPRELKTITDLERLAGKKRLAELCGQYITKPAGKPTLVPESDKRPALNDVRELADF